MSLFSVLKAISRAHFKRAGLYGLEKRILIVTYSVLLVFVIFLLKLWDLQIISGDEYKEISERNRLRIVEIPAPRGLIYDRNDNALVKNIPSFDISAVKEDLPDDDETLSRLGRLLGLSPEEIKGRLIDAPENPFVPVKLKLDVAMEEVARVEARKIDFPGLQVEAIVSREYIYGNFASHAIGYLGRLTLKQAKDPAYNDVPKRAFIGQRGSEKIYDDILRGVAGRKFIEVDAIGRVIRITRVQQPVKGRDIRLTLDKKLQKASEDALKDKIGAIVVIGVNNGEILALASKPSFDPNLFSRGINYDDWERLINDFQKPLLNRSIQSQYPPGSTFKPITALAALEQKVIDSKTKYQCSGSIDIGRVFRCWKKDGHGNIDLHRAIVESCDVYFYEIAKRLDIDVLARYAENFGLGRSTGLELEGEVMGIVPSTEWKLRTKNQKWFMGENLNTAIGQGYLSATPIQMARLTAALVNGGKLYRLHLLKNEGRQPEIESYIKTDQVKISIIKKALIGVVSDKEGTGKNSRSEIVNIGGKTGTTQVIGGDPDKFKDHAWFIAFAPVEDPQISLAVFVEHGGHGSTTAAPIAKKVIEAYFQ
jgi:penicillin-binding protein 2